MSDIQEKRKTIEDKIYSLMDILDPSGMNTERYKKLFGEMSDEEFAVYMANMEQGKQKLTLMAPNLKTFIQQEDCLKAADSLGLKLFERLRIKDEATDKYYTTPNEYIILDLPIRVVRQFLMHKLSVAESDNRINMLTGQVTQEDKASSISYPEVQLLYARGLNKTIEEFMKVRGGDIHAYAQFKQQLEDSGQASMGSLDPNTVPRSTMVLSTILKSIHIDNNFVE